MFLLRCVIAALGSIALPIVAAFAISNTVIVHGHHWLMWIMIFILAMNLTLVHYDVLEGLRKR